MNWGGDCKNVVTQPANPTTTLIESNRNFRNCERVFEPQVDECLHYKRFVVPNSQTTTNIKSK